MQRVADKEGSVQATVKSTRNDLIVYEVSSEVRKDALFLGGFLHPISGTCGRRS